MIDTQLKEIILIKLEDLIVLAFNTVCVNHHCIA